MAERHRPDGLPPVGPVAEALRASLDDPRRIAEELIREHLGATGPFLGDGTPGCPWIVFDREQQFYGFYVRGRELMQVVCNEADRMVCGL
jgi:hypothetical protein